MLPVLGSLESALRDQPLVALGTLFGAGLLTSMTPCIWPMIPITAGILGGAGTVQPRRRTVGLSLLYALGLALVYSSLGLLAGLTGSLFGAVSSNPWAYFTIANLLLLFGLAMLGTVTVQAPAGLLARAGRIAGGSPGGAFLMGATSGLVAAPCGAPAFAAVLLFVAAAGSPVWGFLYLFVFSLGMTAVLVLVGVSSGLLASLPRSGVWLLWVKRGAGVLLLAMSEYYLIQMGKVS